MLTTSALWNSLASARLFVERSALEDGVFHVSAPCTSHGHATIRVLMLRCQGTTYQHYQTHIASSLPLWLQGSEMAGALVHGLLLAGS